MHFPANGQGPTSRPPWSVALLILGVTVLRLLLAATAPLLPQEAYYWTWSRELDWSYFDHPPLASYGIALSTALFGQTVFGIKAAAVLWSLGWNLLWARLILDMYADRRLAFWSLAALNLTVAYEGFGIGPTPDGPLLFAWTGAIWAVWRLSQTRQARWWFVAGAFVGLSWLGKYAGVLLLPVVLLYLVTSPAQRHWLLRPAPYLAILLAVAVFTPVLYWNAQHDWVSLAFQSSRRIEGMGGFQPRYFPMLLATQFLILTPYLAVLVVAALFRGARDWRAGRLGDRERLLLLSAAVPIVFFTLVSFRSIVKINWLIPAYWSLIILAVREMLARADGLKRLGRGLASSAALLLVAAVALAIPNLPIPGDMNSWSGWREAARRVDQLAASIRAEGREAFVFSPNYKISSLLRFHLPGQPRTYAQDIYGAKALQYDYFPLAGSMAGATGILVTSDQSQGEVDLERVRRYFDSVELADTVEVMILGKVTRRVQIYRCTGYKGHPPRRSPDSPATPSGNAAPDGAH